MPFAATCMTLETLILREESQKEKTNTTMISHKSGTLHTAQMKHSAEKILMDLESRLVGCSLRGGEGVGWTGNLGVIYSNYCIWNG